MVQKSCKINNINFSLYDTAGIHEDSSDPIEQEGIALAKSLLNKSDVVIEIVDNTSNDYFVNYKNRSLIETKLIYLKMPLKAD